jgi:hypothetical protein
MKKNKRHYVFLVCIVLLPVMSVFSGAEAFSREMPRTRDPFVPLVGGGYERSFSGIDRIFTPSDVRFEGIVSGAGGKKALVLNGEMISEGQTIGLVTVRSIGMNTAEIYIDGARHIIALYE